VAATVVHVEGDPDAPTNRGTLCPKGSTLKYDIDNPNRILTPKVRWPGGAAAASAVVSRGHG